MSNPPALWEVITRTNTQGEKERGIKLNLHEGQQKAHDSKARVVAVISGTQGGKTSYLPWWLYREISRCGPGDYLAVTATFDLFKIKMLPTIREVLEYTLGVVKYWAGDQVLEICEHEWKEDQQLWIPKPGVFLAKQSGDPMWGRVILRSASSEGGLESATAKAAVLDEAGLNEFGVGAWKAILRRLSLHRGRILITTTPYNNTGWLKTLVYDRWKAGNPNIEVIQFTSVTNPMFPKEEYEERQKDMQEWEFNMMYGGQFEKPPGMIYPDYDDSMTIEGGMVVEPFPVKNTKDQRWMWVIGVDPGPVYYTLLWGAIDLNTETLYIIEEDQYSYKSTDEIVGDVILRQRMSGRWVAGYFVGGKPDVQYRTDWSNAGAVPVYEPPFSGIEEGIDRVTSLLRRDRFRVFATCKRLRAQFLDYRRKVTDTGDVLEEIDNPKIYHFIDALRYIAAGLSVSRDVLMAPAPAAMTDYRGDL